MPIELVKREDFSPLDLVPLGKRRHPVRVAIMAMIVGDIIRVTRDEFTMKHRTPNYLCRDIEKKTGREFIVSRHRVSRDWIIERVK